MGEYSLNLVFYGIGITIESSGPKVLNAIGQDFSYFRVPKGPTHFRITCCLEKPDYENLPVMMASSATPRNICYKNEQETYIDYFGKALNIYNKRENTCRIITDDEDLALAIAYLTILSRVSERLDQSGMHRIHALGIEYHKRGVLVLLPAGGGKTALAISILTAENNDMRLLSEDSPLIMRDGTLLPFPVSIAVHPRSMPTGIDNRFIRMEKRLETEPKMRIDVSYFGDRIATAAVKPSLILLGKRSTGDISEITPVPKTAMVKHSLMNSVIGVGLFQGMEFIMQNNAAEVASQTRVLCSRLWNNVQLVRKSKIYSFVMGRNLMRNYLTLNKFLHDYFGNA